MKQSFSTPSPCGAKQAQETMKLLGDFWILRIIDALTQGELRFCELERILQDSNPATITKRLKQLESANFIARSEASQDKQSVSYSLTSKGQDIIPVLQAISSFSKTYN